MKMTCATCGYETRCPVVGVDVVRGREYLWCAKCVEITASGVVAFPSRGKMIPETILTSEGK